ANRAAGGGQRGPGHGTFELADIARPLVTDEQIERLSRKTLAVERQPLRGAVPGEEALRQHWKVALPLAQRWQPDGERVHPVIEVLTEPSVLDELFERAVGR